MTKIYYKRITISIVSLILVSCHGKQVDRVLEKDKKIIMSYGAKEWLTHDEYSKVSLDDDIFDAAERDFFPVLHSRANHAIKKLNTKQFQLISNEDLSFYLNKTDLKVGKGYKAYLVRAVFTNDLGDYYVKYSSKENLIIAYSTLGIPYKHTKRPIIVVLENSPKNVYVIETSSI